MDITTFAAAALLALLPHATRRPPPGWAEDKNAYETRIRSIASDIGQVAANRREAAYLIGVLAHESGADPDVDAGQCYRKGKWFQRCDGGQAVSVYQLRAYSKEQFDLLRANRREATKEALRRIKSSANACRKNPIEERLAAYAGGSCSNEKAKQVARELHRHVERALNLRVDESTGS